MIFPMVPVVTVAPLWCAEHGTECEKRNGRHGELYGHRIPGGGRFNEKASTFSLVRLYFTANQTITKEGYNADVYRTSQLHGPGG